MKKILFLGWILLLSGFTLTVSAQVSNDNEEGVYKIQPHGINEFVPGQVLVKFKDVTKVQVRRVQGKYESTSASQVSAVLKKYGTDEMEQLLPQATVSKHRAKAKAYNGDVIEDHDLTQLYCVKLNNEHSQEVMQLVDELNKIEEVEFAEPNYRMYIMADDNIATDYSGNPMVGEQWYLDAYGVKELWNKPLITKERPVIAIIDTGVDITHPDLMDNIWINTAELNGSANADDDRNGLKDDLHGWDFVNNTANMRDNNKHGTHVAGIAAAANNGLGIVGANPRALLMPITVMQSDGSGDVATIVKGIDYAVKNGATVLNLSLGMYNNSSALRQALESAYQKAVIVAAAGNEGKCIYASHYAEHMNPPGPVPEPCFPAAYSFVLGVQATTNGGGLASFSNYDDDGALFSCETTITTPNGINYELKAPGTNILSTVPGGQYVTLNGTSMAAPLVAGAISALQMVKQYDSQEILWGDLLHTGNIAQAYNILDRPAELEIMKVMLRSRKELAEETEEDYIGNNEVNVGETISIYPVIRSSFGRATNIKLKLTALNAEILAGEADFGYNLDAFGKAVSKNPLKVKVPDDMPNASEIEIIVQATCDESNLYFGESFSMKVNNMWTLKGLLTEDQTLTANHVYYVSDNLGIENGVKLTIEPGTRLEFAPGVGMASFGKLVANGTPEHPIIFTGHDKKKKWGGVVVHGNELGSMFSGMYTNVDQTLFTFVRTNNTTIRYTGNTKSFYYSDTEYNPSKTFSLGDYTDKVKDAGYALYVKGDDEELKDPNFITPYMLEMIEDWNNYYSQYPTEESEGMSLRADASISINRWYPLTNIIDTVSYCYFDGCYLGMKSYRVSMYPPVMSDCLYKPFENEGSISYGKGERYKNTINYTGLISAYCSLGKENYFNNYEIRDGKRYVLEVGENKIVTNPPYLGTSREDVIRPYIWEKGNASGVWETLDLRNMRKEPVREAHGIVWKILVNGKDVQDEQEDLLPLGVGKHKFEIYFNRPMNTAVRPQISFGLREPYTQQSVAEDAFWNVDGTIFTAFKSIEGTTKSNGINRIYVRGAEDNEYFECPYEATRFNIMIQTAGSLASGFEANAGLGCVNLSWHNENNDFEDAMGFNIYRYTENENGQSDTIRLNEEVLDISTTTYIDDQVSPGQTYYYYYKVLSTDLQEYDVSNVVAATPVTATRGDANGSGSVDVADIITTVNYITGLQPKPFVFDAADMNKDRLIDIFDVVSIIQGILNPKLLAAASFDDLSATFSIEDGTVYVNNPMSLAGIQIQLELADGQTVSATGDLDGFEHASSWLSDSDYLFLAYSINGKTLVPGKHALLHIGDAKIITIRLSDLAGRNVTAVEEDSGSTKINSLKRNVIAGDGVYDLQGRKVTVRHKQNMLQHGVYIINGKKVVK